MWLEPWAVTRPILLQTSACLALSSSSTSTTASCGSSVGHRTSSSDRSSYSTSASVPRKVSSSGLSRRSAEAELRHPCRFSNQGGAANASADAGLGFCHPAGYTFHTRTTLSVGYIITVRGQGYSCQDADDGNHDHQFNQGETFLTLSFHLESPWKYWQARKPGNVQAVSVPSLQHSKY